MLKQKLVGAGLIGAGVLCLKMLAGAQTVQEADGGGAFLVIVIGAILLFSRSKVLLDLEDYR